MRCTRAPGGKDNAALHRFYGLDLPNTYNRCYAQEPGSFQAHAVSYDGDALLGIAASLRVGMPGYQKGSDAAEHLLSTGGRRVQEPFRKAFQFLLEKVS
jgi:hypothetical protein